VEERRVGWLPGGGEGGALGFMVRIVGGRVGAGIDAI